MPKRGKSIPLESRVLTAFHQAYAEEAFEVADRLLAILEHMARQDRPASERAAAAVREVYSEIAAATECNPPPRRPKRLN